MANKFSASRKAIKQSKLDEAIRNLEDSPSSIAQNDIQRIAFENQTLADADGAEMVLRRRARDELFTRNFRWLNVNDILANPKNYFEIDQDELEGLASLILSTGYTDPIIVREVEIDGQEIIQLVDGERRTMAHKLLGDTVDECWYMVPARYYSKGTLSDEAAEFMLSAQNLGQRNMSESNRTTAFAAVADELVRRKMQGDPEANAQAIKDQLAKQFGCSPRQAAMNINIGRHLSDLGLRMLDEKKITKSAADAIATLSASDQEEILSLVSEGSLPKSQVETTARNMSDRRKSSVTRAPASFDGFVNSALKSLKRAHKLGGTAQRKDIAALRDLIDSMDPDLANR
ncbi:MAG: ParB N-terminal domain-containing protein [Eggerthellaceae bacterium]|nr:ParB N-terminal domain-containing protein [Eggerthellaceae bacterium]